MINKVILLGYLGKDPETKVSANGVNTVRVSMATNKRYKNETGNPVEKTEWHNLVAFNKVGEIVAKYLKKGSRVYVEGELSTVKFEKDGHTSYYTSVIVNVVKMLDAARADNQRTADAGGVPDHVITDAPPADNDDLPF